MEKGKWYRRIVLPLVCALLALGIGACDSEDSIDKRIKNALIESEDKLGDELLTGKLYVEGDIFEVPFKVKDFVKKGYEISEKYENKDKFKLDGLSTSTPFLVKKNNAVIEIVAFNDSKEEKKIEDCKVLSVSIDMKEVVTVLPGGVSSNSYYEDIKKTYGEPEKEKTVGELESVQYSFGVEGGQCKVTLNTSKDNEADFGCEFVKYELKTDLEMFIETNDAETVCGTYIDASLKASYYGEYKEFVDAGIDTEEYAKNLYNSYVLYYTNYLMYSLGVDNSAVTEELKAKYIELSKKILNSVKWNLDSINVVENDGVYQGSIEITVYPSNFLEECVNSYNEVANKFNEDNKGIDVSKITKEELKKLELKYANDMYAAVKKYASNVKASKTGKTFTFELETDGNIISQEKWDQIDNAIMGITESVNDKIKNK